MPIPGPTPAATLLDDANPTDSPFWLQLNGVWLQAEGVLPGVGVDSERPSSEFVSLDGARYAQRAPLARRQWEWSFTHETPAVVAAARVATETDSDVWLWSDSTLNMLAPRDCYGSTLPAIDCGGIPLPTFEVGATATVRVRGGVPVTLSAWSTQADGVETVVATWTGGTTSIDNHNDGSAQGQISFTVPADGDVSIEIQTTGVSGLMLTEGGTAPAGWVAGESMPCKVSITDPADTMTMYHQGAYRHDYVVQIREVG